MARGMPSLEDNSDIPMTRKAIPMAIIKSRRWFQRYLLRNNSRTALKSMTDVKTWRLVSNRLELLSKTRIISRVKKLQQNDFNKFLRCLLRENKKW
jgi:hypothetical protein